jgi:hypothetical protein
MTAWVLVLAGLTAGDGGQVMGAAGEPVGVNFEACAWEGTWQVGDCSPVPVELRRCRLTFGVRGGGEDMRLSSRCTIRPQPNGGIAFTWGGTLFQGTYRLDGSRVIIRLKVMPAGVVLKMPAGVVGTTLGEVLILHPAASKP